MADAPFYHKEQNLPTLTPQFEWSVTFLYFTYIICTETVFLNVYGAPESIPRNEFRQPYVAWRAGRYGYPLPSRFRAPIDSLKIPAQYLLYLYFFPAFPDCPFLHSSYQRNNSRINSYNSNWRGNSSEKSGSQLCSEKLCPAVYIGNATQHLQHVVFQKQTKEDWDYLLLLFLYKMYCWCLTRKHGRSQGQPPWQHR
jgi:hypothetical protein